MEGEVVGFPRVVRIGLTKKVKCEQSLEGAKDTGIVEPGQEPFWQRELLGRRPR